MTAPSPAQALPHAHWLLEEARHAGLASSAPDIPPSTPLGEAWDRVAADTGASPDHLAALVAERYHLPLADLDRVDPAAVRLIPEAVARYRQVLPLRLDRQRLVLATADPLNVDVERELGFACGRDVTFAVAPADALRTAIETHYAPERVMDVLLEGLPAEQEGAVRVVRTTEPESVSERELAAPPVVRLTNVLLQQAVHMRATDIHIEPERSGGRVRFRVDGVLQPFMNLPMSALVRIVSRIKILAELDIADHLRPQDGRIRVEVDGRPYDLRISTMPTRKAEKCVIRILDPEANFSLESLALPDPEAGRIKELLKHRDGIVIMTGPTGCGKTTTLYAAIRTLAANELNVSTVENPVEYELPGITQVQVETKQGLTFASTLRALLRQDPNVILVGEIRDPETAETAARAAMTGHLVLSTLHTTDAATAIPRLQNLGLEPDVLSATLRGVVAQRLVRHLCDACAAPVKDVEELTVHERDLARVVGMVPPRRAVGCEVCHHTGYFGRIPVSEVLVLDPALSRLVARGAAAWELEEEAVRHGMRTMQRVGLDRVSRGETTLTELQRVLGADLGGEAPAPARLRIVLASAGSEGLDLHEAFREVDTVLRVPDVEAAVHNATTDPGVSLLVADYDLPGGGAAQVIRQLRASIRWAGVPIVVLSAVHDDTEEREVLGLGADDYMSRTGGVEYIGSRLRAALRRRGEPTNPASVNP